MAPGIVIVGAGQAGAQLAISLRQGGCDSPITLLGDEPEPPYQRPPLSKKYLTGEVAADRAYIKPASFYAQNGIELVLDCRVALIDRAGRRVRDHAGREWPYDMLALCTGARARELPLPGTELDGVLYLRTLADARRIRERAGAARHVVVIGGGYIGLEVAASLRQLGCEVDVLEALERVLARVVVEPVAAFFAEDHRRHGVRITTSVAIAGIAGDGRAEAVLGRDGERWPAGLVVVGIGAVPNVELAAAAGLAVDNGIVVDAQGRTSDPLIFAAGDATNHPSGLYGRRLRLESVHNAMAQAKTVAAAMAGRDAAYDEVPWFWSDQYDLKLQIAGCSSGEDEVLIRGDPAARSFSCLHLREGRLTALDAINRAGDFIAAKRLIAARAVIDPARAVDPAVRLGG
jgi:3-phenylpropionate/trans-cinnamate dioxygenase ferredoxin reductase subunit